jgi:hypothetical protein
MTLRDHLSLDGAWDFQFDATGNLSFDQITSWRTAQVPMPWQAQFPDLHKATGVGWYRRSFEVPASWAGRAAVLHFGAADYLAEVWVNGHYVGSHEGGYLPFEFGVSAWLRPGQPNEVLVRVVDPGADRDRYPDYPMAEIPHGKQSWYGPQGGLWQSVWIEARHSIYLYPIRITPNPHTAQVTVDARLSGPSAPDMAIVVAITDPDDKTVAQGSQELPTGATSASLTLDVPGFRWWSPESPALYHAEARLLLNESTVDAMGDTFGFRTIEARDRRIWLNGQPLYLRSALDQDYYPGTIGTPPSDAFLDDQFRKARELGLNSLRIHIKVGDPRYYRAADRAGLLIWSEIPNWNLLTEKAKARARATLEGMIERDWNRPSLIAWSIVNEGWGLDMPHNAEHRAWLKEMVAYARRLDPHRLIVDNSPCPPNFHVQSDLDDYHTYRAMPDHYREFDAWVEELASRPDWTYSPFGDAVRTRQEPLVVSEFGNWGLPDADLLSAHGEPWWFETGLEWGEGVVYPHGVQRRCRLWGLDRVFGSFQELVKATQWQQHLALKSEIEAMRRRGSIQGYVITEFTDVHWECNGLLDMERRPKVFHQVLRRINADDVIVPWVGRWGYWAGEDVTVRLWLSRYGAADPGVGVVRWWVDGTPLADKEPVPDVARGQVVDLGSITFPAPVVVGKGGQQFVLHLRWKGASGRVVAENDLTLSVFPEAVQAAVPGVALRTPDGALAERLRALQWPVADAPGPGVVTIARQLDNELYGRVQNGERLLLLADGLEALSAPLPRARIVPRAGTSWQGDWASSFSWLRRTGPYAALPGGPLLDFGFSRVIPEHVIVGLSPWDFQGDVDAGMFVGWIHKPVGLAARLRYGRGVVLITTFRLSNADIGTDPVATALLRALVARLGA